LSVRRASATRLISTGRRLLACDAGAARRGHWSPLRRGVVASCLTQTDSDASEASPIELGPGLRAP
jgi:hypothetical protein